MPDNEELYELVSNAMYEFIQDHIVSFPNALVSKTDFWGNKSYKRAMVFVFMCHFLFGLIGQKQWREFSERDYKLNVRLFNKWISVDDTVMPLSTKYRKLPNEATPSKRKRTGRGRRKPGASRQDSSTEDVSPKKILYVRDEFTDDDLEMPVSDEGSANESNSGHSSVTDDDE